VLAANDSLQHHLAFVTSVTASIQTAIYPTTRATTIASRPLSNIAVASDQDVEVSVGNTQKRSQAEYALPLESPVFHQGAAPHPNKAGPIRPRWQTPDAQQQLQKK
jgi:hypothetical protein